MWLRQAGKGPSNSYSPTRHADAAYANRQGQGRQRNAQLKVYYKWPSGSENTVPLIMLQGEWLRKAGFDIGDEVLVTMEKNRLTIDFERKAD
jgi:hypothetical protein